MEPVMSTHHHNNSITLYNTLYNTRSNPTTYSTYSIQTTNSS